MMIDIDDHFFRMPFRIDGRLVGYIDNVWIHRYEWLYGLMYRQLDSLTFSSRPVKR